MRSALVAAPAAAAKSSEMPAPAVSATRRAIARTGTLLRDVATPCYLPPSVAGHVPHLTPDNCAKVRDLKAHFIDFADM